MSNQDNIRSLCPSNEKHAAASVVLCSAFSSFFYPFYFGA